MYAYKDNTRKRNWVPKFVNSEQKPHDCFVENWYKSSEAISPQTSTCKTVINKASTEYTEIRIYREYTDKIGLIKNCMQEKQHFWIPSLQVVAFVIFDFKFVSTLLCDRSVCAWHVVIWQNEDAWKAFWMSEGACRCAHTYTVMKFLTIKY